MDDALDSDEGEALDTELLLDALEGETELWLLLLDAELALEGETLDALDADPTIGANAAVTMVALLIVEEIVAVIVWLPADAFSYVLPACVVPGSVATTKSHRSVPTLHVTVCSYPVPTVVTYKLPSTVDVADAATVVPLVALPTPFAIAVDWSHSES